MQYAQKKQTIVRWKVFAIIFILVIINMIDRASLPIAMPIISEEFELSNTMQGLILSSFFWTYAIMQIPGGLLADRFGPRKVVTWSTVLWGIAQMMLAFCTGGISLLIARMFLGGSEAPVFPSGTKLNATWLRSSERARGATFMDAGGPLGAALGGIIISWLIIFFGSWRLAFIIAGAATVALGVIAWLYLRDLPSQHPSINQEEIDYIEQGQVKATENTAVAHQQGQSIPMQSMVAMILGRMAWAMMFFGLLNWGPSYLAKANGLDLKGIGYATFIIFVCGCIGSLSGGFLADFLVNKGLSRGVSSKILLSLSGFCTCIAFFILPNMSSVNGCIALLCCAAFMLMWGSLYWSFPVLLAPKAKVGVVSGTMNMAGSIGGIVIPIIAGWMLDMANDSYEPVLYLFAGCALFFVIMTNVINLKHAQ